MTYEVFIQNADRLRAQAEEYNTWREGVNVTLYTEVAPRIAAIKQSRTMFCGCGFFYDVEQTFTKLVAGTIFDWQLDGNTCENYRSDVTKSIMRRVEHRQMLETLDDIEACQAAHVAKTPCQCQARREARKVKTNA